MCVCVKVCLSTTKHMNDRNTKLISHTERKKEFVINYYFEEEELNMVK